MGALGIEFVVVDDGAARDRASIWGRLMRVQQLLNSTPKSRRLLAQRAAKVRWANVRRTKKKPK